MGPLKGRYPEDPVTMTEQLDVKLTRLLYSVSIAFNLLVVMLAPFLTLHSLFLSDPLLLLLLFLHLSGIHCDWLNAPAQRRGMFFFFGPLFAG